MKAKKLSTAAIKEFISQWLSKQDMRDEMKNHSEVTDPNRIVQDWRNNKEVTAFEYERRIWKAPKSVETSEQLEQFIWDLWRDGTNWKREEKRKLGDEAEDTFSEVDWNKKPEGWEPGPNGAMGIPRIPSFPCDIFGEHDEQLMMRFLW